MYFIRNFLFYTISLFVFFANANQSDESVYIYVSNKASINGDGSFSLPYNSLLKAIAKARTIKNKPVTIVLAGGVYTLTDTVKLTKIDSRDSNYPLMITSFKNEEVEISGEKELSAWSEVTTPAVLERIPSSSRKNIYATNLFNHGVTNFGSAKFGGVELYHNDKKMHLARYPNNGLLKINKLIKPGSKIVRSHTGTVEGQFYYEDTTIDNWTGEDDVYLNGYWFWDWKQEIQSVKSIDTNRKIISLKKPYHVYGYRSKQEYFAFNILTELDAKNEWYLDRDNGDLYFYPSTEIANIKPKLAVVDNIISLNNVSNITIQNITFSYAKNNGVFIEGGEHNLLKNVVVKHIGNTAISILNSSNTKVVSSHIYSVGGSAINVHGGNRDELISGDICIINSKVHDYANTIKTYQPGISIRGVGNCAINNEIFNAPHFAIYFEGNNHNIKYNEIYNVVKESNDAGAIYAGRDWTSRGTIIANNYLHNIQGYKNGGAKGIYLDDEFSGVTIINNIFDNVYDAVFIGGGKDNTVSNNLFINTFRSIYIDARGIGWAEDQFSQLLTKFKRVPHNSDVWKKSYPRLSNVLKVDPRLPVGNVVNNNVFFDDGWNAIREEAAPYVQLGSNHLLMGEKPAHDYSLSEKLHNFKAIQFEKIGIQDSIDF
ncbi:right-handed parallel beta-helix repeat-containing protein [Pseudoalteromonas marina]|uniref:right-handed parallel beta-helix repeat-containing protein n=1 Tax=Pseudoalteromonas marina TaxID=267375 RepID=UPI0027323418|nr:right-handed parallel beta-helix repeat-containing protein [Pseudoalteromonas marina]MDP2485787.1 right-handed parallel beta-helix repeat-containing protein [Pseudoalteromonas marina]